MTSENTSRIVVRDAEVADVPMLTAIKGDGTEALHRDRLHDAQGGGFRYLVLLVDQEIIGFACLVFRRPEHWPDADEMGHLPQIVDLQVNELHRDEGYGSEFMRAIERIASAAGYKHIYLGVEPLDNPRAYAFYQRLGYQQEQLEPYRKTWQFRDSDGNVHQGENWVVDMVKRLNA